MKPPKSIIIVKNNVAEKTADLPNLPTQQLYEKNEIVPAVITNEVIVDQTFYPKSIHLEDLDEAFVNWVKNFQLEIEGVLVPVKLFTIQRFSEFMQNWDNTDVSMHPTLPIITVTKESPAKQGTYLGAVSTTLPSGETFPLYRIPKIVNGRSIFEYVEVPQPTYIDMQYKINIFTNHMRSLNKFNEIILQEFKKPQNTINVFGHNMELKLDDISENHKREIEERRYYRQIFVINLKAFLLDEKDFKYTRSLNAIKMAVQPDTPKIDSICNVEIVGDLGVCGQCLIFNLNKKSQTDIEYIMPFAFNVNYDNQSSLFNNVDYFVNDVPVNIPFSINKNETLKLSYNKTITKPVQIKVCGEKSN